MPGEFYQKSSAKAQTVDIKTILERLDLLEAKLSAGELPPRDFWSQYAPQVQLTTVTEDKALPEITIEGLPAGAVIIRARMLCKFRILENTSANLNSLNGAQNIQARKQIDGDWITGIALAGGEMAVQASTRETGDVLLGTQDIASQIPASGGQVDLRWANARATQDNLNFNDVQVGVRIWYGISN
jgi:hypothetical protein